MPHLFLWENAFNICVTSAMVIRTHCVHTSFMQHQNVVDILDVSPNVARTWFCHWRPWAIESSGSHSLQFDKINKLIHYANQCWIIVIWVLIKKTSLKFDSKDMVFFIKKMQAKRRFLNSWLFCSGLNLWKSSNSGQVFYLWLCKVVFNENFDWDLPKCR